MVQSESRRSSGASLLEKLQEYDTEMERLQQMGELYVGTQGESLASLMEQRELLLNDTQEALTRLMQEEPEGERLADDSNREKQQSPTAPNNLTRDSKVSSDGKVPFLMEEDEEHEEDEDVVKSGERNQTPVSAVAPSLSLLEDLHMCQDRAAALEFWLDTVQESLGKCAGDQEMHRDVEEHLLQSQEKAVRIQELLGWEEIPLELQVESTVKKKIEQVKHTNKRLNTMHKEPTTHLGHSAAKHEPAGVPSESDSRQDASPLSHDREGALPAFEFKVEGQQHSPHGLGGHEELVQSGEDPREYSDDDVTPTAEELPETPRPQPERSEESGNDGLHRGETEPRRRQCEASEEETQAKRRRELWSVQTEQDQDKQRVAKTPLHPQDTKQEKLEK
ncbi:uncharacterized protein LOC109925095 [Rhincodon typus]|uniref:uncharacterized protein LOC109925095 n=1 Tax=Rhincodon typus TaxID=259920 RepID=UPI00202DC325|nr:uncharacterized protein LOC109925095 [Rhincodon typus]